MGDDSITSIVTMIFFTALIMGLLLGLTVKSIQGQEDIFIFNNVEKLCQPVEGDAEYSSCSAGLAGVIVLTFILSILEILRLKGKVGKYNVGIVVYLLGGIMGFIISAIL